MGHLLQYILYQISAMMSHSQPLRPSEYFDSVILGGLRQYVNDIDKILESYRLSSEKLNEIKAKFESELKSSRLDPYIVFKLKVFWCYFSKRMTKGGWPSSELHKIRNQVTGLLDKFTNTPIEQPENAKFVKEAIFRVIEYWLGDPKNNEILKHKEYLRQFDEELAKAQDKSKITEVNKRLLEHKQAEKDCVDGIFSDFNKKLKEIEKNGIEAVCKPPPPQVNPQGMEIE